MKLLCVVAHPDDECFGFGGALALAADRGAETHVLCLTEGRAATSRGSARSDEELGQMRRAEFAASCEVLGVTQHEMLSLQDGHLESALFSETVDVVLARIRRICPDIVLTFAADGGLNTHSDHMMVSAFTTAAFHWAGRERRSPELGAPFQPGQLYYLSTEFFFADRQPPLPPPWTVRLDIRSVKDRKLEAFRRHTSQAPLIERTKDLFEKHGDEEFYSLAASTEAGPARILTQLFGT